MHAVAQKIDILRGCLPAEQAAQSKKLGHRDNMVPEANWQVMVG